MIVEWVAIRDELPPINKKVWIYEAGGVRETLFGSNWGKSRVEFAAHLSTCNATHWALYLPPDPPAK